MFIILSVVYLFISYAYCLFHIYSKWKSGWSDFRGAGGWFTALIVVLSPLVLSLSLLLACTSWVYHSLKSFSIKSSNYKAGLISYSWSIFPVGEYVSYRNLSIGLYPFSLHCEYSFDVGGWSVGLGWLLISWGWFSRPITVQEG